MRFTSPESATAYTWSPPVEASALAGSSKAASGWPSGRVARASVWAVNRPSAFGTTISTGMRRVAASAEGMMARTTASSVCAPPPTASTRTFAPTRSDPRAVSGRVSFSTSESSCSSVNSSLPGVTVAPIWSGCSISVPANGAARSCRRREARACASWARAACNWAAAVAACKLELLLCQSLTLPFSCSSAWRRAVSAAFADRGALLHVQLRQAAGDLEPELQLAGRLQGAGDLLAGEALHLLRLHQLHGGIGRRGSSKGGLRLRLRVDGGDERSHEAGGESGHDQGAAGDRHGLLLAGELRFSRLVCALGSLPSCTSVCSERAHSRRSGFSCSRLIRTASSRYVPTMSDPNSSPGMSGRQTPCPWYRWKLSRTRFTSVSASSQMVPSNAVPWQPRTSTPTTSRYVHIASRVSRSEQVSSSISSW